MHAVIMEWYPPKVSISDFLRTVEGGTTIRVCNQFRHLKKKPYWSNHFWTKGCYIDTVRLDSEMIRTYGKHQDGKDKE